MFCWSLDFHVCCLVFFTDVSPSQHTGDYGYLLPSSGQDQNCSTMVLIMLNVGTANDTSPLSHGTCTFGADGFQF